MNSVFVSEEISNQWADKSPLNPPVVGHASRQGWENHGVANYKKVFGEADYAKYTQSDLPIPMPTKSVALKKELDRRVFGALEFGTKALVTGRRATHMRGVGGRGTIRIVDQPEFPEHEFFQPDGYSPVDFAMLTLRFMTTRRYKYVAARSNSRIATGIALSTSS